MSGIRIYRIGIRKYCIGYIRIYRIGIRIYCIGIRIFRIGMRVYRIGIRIHVYTYIPGVSALSHRLQSRSDAAVRAVAKTPIDASNCGPAARLKQNMSKQLQKQKNMSKQQQNRSKQYHKQVTSLKHSSMPSLLIHLSLYFWGLEISD